ncbi:glycosaminoglycan xylosylkinase-like isoform X1 [Tachypleus tridentatus]|uniref:glycosaminoglycan xylosylkinase-like isoform X1 n=3 Tax=Tachypleus tridentatus TaxID=6853 RepID=UPI003FD1B495
MMFCAVMKLKTRIRLILSLCLVMVLSLLLYFHLHQTEFQLSEENTIARNQIQISRRNKETVINQQSLNRARVVGNSNTNDLHSIKYKYNASLPRTVTLVGLKVSAKLRQLNTTRISNSQIETRIQLLKRLVSDLNSQIEMADSPWHIAANWVTPRSIHPEEAPEIGTVLAAMTHKKILFADVTSKGTQLKMVFDLEGGQKVIFKPMRFKRDFVIDGPPYAGADRHNGEIASFHLNRLLGFRRSPLVVGRKVNLRTEVTTTASKSLLETFLKKDNNTCFYGKCFYCKRTDPACGEGDVLEGAVILWLPETFVLKKYRSPWQRTYRKDVPARWEVDPNFCVRVQQLSLYQSGSRLLDLIDASVFDYLIGNADRHHYEVFEDIKDSMVLLLDNGKSFGNPYWDELTILAPLYQCCRLRKTTYDRLLLFMGSLTESMRTLLMADPLVPVLADSHLEAFDPRLNTIISVIDICIEEYGYKKVLIENG